MPLVRWSLLSRIAASVVGLGLAVVAASPAYSEAPGGQPAVAADSSGRSGLHLPFAGHIGGIVKDDQPIVDVTVDKFGGGIFAVAPAGFSGNEQCSTLEASVPKGTDVFRSPPSRVPAGKSVAGPAAPPLPITSTARPTAAEGGHIHVSFGQIGTAFTAPAPLPHERSTTGMHISGTTYTFPSNSELDSVLAGDFIATFEGDGFLRKVLTLNRHDNVVDMDTADASILDVIANGTLTLGLVPLPGVTPPPGGQGFDINLPINATSGRLQRDGQPRRPRRALRRDQRRQRRHPVTPHRRHRLRRWQRPGQREHAEFAGSSRWATFGRAASPASCAGLRRHLAYSAGDWRSLSGPRPLAAPSRSTPAATSTSMPAASAPAAASRRHLDDHPA